LKASVIVRFARLDDRSSILRLVEHTWDWGDYIPEVLDEWLSGSDSRLFVGELDSEIVALTHLSICEGRVGWLEGLRVKEGLRNRGIATLVAQHIAQYARSEGIHKLRMMIYSDNYASIRHAKKSGFSVRGTFRRVRFRGTSSTRPVLFCRTAEWSSVPANALEDYCGLLYTSWKWLDLNQARFEKLVASGKVFSDGEQILIHSSDYADDNAKRCAEVGFTSSMDEALVGSLASSLVKTGYQTVEFVIPSNWYFSKEEFSEDIIDENRHEQLIFEREL
jgi:RimJ/RimL family protein N-acetyltransferase